MADLRSRRRSRAALLVSLAAALLLVAALPSAALAATGRQQPIEHIVIADVPGTQGEDCVDDPGSQPGVGLKKCETPFTIASLIPFVAGGVLVLLAIAVGWYLVMRRRASRPFLPDEALATAGGATSGAGGGVASGEWWKCKSCGSSNMVGVARCYKCGAWPR
ncbi:MAG TPA: hypothetical protein VJ850_01520 [Candidatus Limnocylindrales bacterium]|nr:hypothetical protein [Candidatus Limnocylindrales bacterium]